MSENLNELCCLLVEEFYGEFHCRLYSNLTYQGRLSAPQLAQRTSVPLRQVKIGLAALVQSQMVFHHTTSEGLSTYQANTDATYRLLRIGRLTELVRTKIGNLAADVISEACVLGFATVAELELKTRERLSNCQILTLNGDHDDTNPDTEQHQDIRITIRTLLDHGYLRRVRTAQFQTFVDAKMDSEKHAIGLGLTSSLKGKTAASKLARIIKKEMEQKLTPKTSEHGYAPDTLQPRKRTMEETDDLPSSKRQRVNEDGSSKLNGVNGMSSASDYICGTILVCVNFNSVVTNLREKHLAERAKRCPGGVCSQVISAALSQVPITEQWTMPTEEDLPSEEGLPSEEDLSTEEDRLDLRQIQQQINRHEHGHQQNGYHQNGTRTHEDDIDEEKITYSEVDRALARLADGGFDFLRGTYGQGWSISKQALDQIAQQDELSRIMHDRLGATALRIVRMLKDKGKLDEKSLQEIGLLGAKDLRQVLAELKQMGFIDLQEVPRESQRQPNRTIFLWFHDPDRVQKVIVDGLYKAIVRLMQRLRLERNRLASTLEKVERSDVQGNEDQIMSDAELTVLRRWRRTEQWLLGEVTRLDESVALLRDL